MKKIVNRIKEGKALAWVKDKAPDVLDFVGDVTGVGALNQIADLVDKSDLSEEDKIKFKELYELEIKEIDIYLSDVQDARKREVGMAKTGKTDWMMYATGGSGLLAFIIMVTAAIFVKETRENPIFHQLMGIVEGITLTIFYYYFGSSKSSADKNDLLKGKQ